MVLVIATSVLVPDAVAQGVVCSLGPAALAANYSAAADQSAPPRAHKDLKQIVGILCPKGCGRVGLFKNWTAPSAMSLNVGHGMSKIAYSPGFMDRVQDVYGTDASFGILAHEVGHHVDANGSPAGWMDGAWTSELRADAWAGCALARAGMRIDGFKGALRAVSTTSAGTDPSWELRTAAMQRGYSSCGGNVGLKLASAQSVTLSKRGGCAGNTECRAGRVCLEGRCQDGVARGGCLKDIDCPDGQICQGTGHCQSLIGGGLIESAATVVSLAQDGRDGTAAADCHKRCDPDRRRCRIGAMKTLNLCLGRVRTDPEYVGCACPNWPASKPECHRVCEDGFEAAESCESAYVPTRDACLSTAGTCAGCETPPAAPAGGRESALK